MIARDKIKRQLNRTNLLIPGCMLTFLFSLTTTDIIEMPVVLITGAIASVTVLIWALIFVSPKCPFCNSNVVTCGDRIGNYCRDCGNSFDKKVP